MKGKAYQSDPTEVEVGNARQDLGEVMERQETDQHRASRQQNARPYSAEKRQEQSSNPEICAFMKVCMAKSTVCCLPAGCDLVPSFFIPVAALGCIERLLCTCSLE
jgi:hypothetical protein